MNKLLITLIASFAMSPLFTYANESPACPSLKDGFSIGFVFPEFVILNGSGYWKTAAIFTEANSKDEAQIAATKAIDQTKVSGKKAHKIFTTDPVKDGSYFYACDNFTIDTPSYSNVPSNVSNIIVTSKTFPAQSAKNSTQGAQKDYSIQEKIQMLKNDLNK